MQIEFTCVNDVEINQNYVRYYLQNHHQAVFLIIHTATWQNVV